LRIWKGWPKPLALAAMAMTVIAAFFHYIRVGPNETDESDEARAAAEKAKIPGPENKP
jgi:formate dehydrogenase iron-sulfur subunit